MLLVEIKLVLFSRGKPGILFGRVISLGDVHVIVNFRLWRYIGLAARLVTMTPATSGPLATAAAIIATPC